MKNSIENFTTIIEDVNDIISTLLEQSDAEKKKDVKSIRKEISDLKKLIRNKDSESSFDFSRIRLRFDGEYELQLPKYGVETFNRKLKGEMYFTVLGGTDEYMDIKTTSFPNTFRIRLTYKTLEELKNQTGKAFLIYRRGREKLKGEETNVTYKILKKS
ncbi:hypothetical protein K9M18_06455 [Candidatus Woesearchaeota archaeon]|nr:hypothetical protein [Candidatus Woesearchaeota archaeon]